MNLIPGNRYLFDTCVYIDLLHGREIGKSLHNQARYAQISVGYSIITEAELWQGIGGLRTEAQHTDILRAYKRYFMNVTVARNAGRFWRELRHVDKLPKQDMPGLADCLIAATAHYYDLRLVTNNTRHFPVFAKFGVLVDEYTT